MIGATTSHSLSGDDGLTYAVNTVKIKEISFPEMSRDTSEDSYLDSAEIFKEFVAGMIDAGELSLTFKWDFGDAGQTQLLAAINDANGTVMGRITFPDGVTYTYVGVVTSAGKEIPKNETITQAFKIKISGKPVEAAAAA